MQIYTLIRIYQQKVSKMLKVFFTFFKKLVFTMVLDVVNYIQ